MEWFVCALLLLRVPMLQHLLVVCLLCACATQVASDMAVMVEEGINSFKFFLAYKGALQVTDEQFINGLRRCKELGALAQV